MGLSEAIMPTSAYIVIGCIFKSNRLFLFLGIGFKLNVF